jgi:hypothetical protein
MWTPGPGSASLRGAFEYPACEWHLRGAPYVARLEGPGVDRATVANQLKQPRFVELLRGPLVYALQPRDDHRVIEQPTKTLLVGDVALDLARERIAVRNHAPEREERPGAALSAWA